MENTLPVATDYSHLNSAACWVPLAICIILLLVASVAGKSRLIVLAFVAVVVSALGSSYWFKSTERAADARDRYVVKTLAEGDVTFVDFLDSDTERVRVSREVDGKECDATFDVVLGGYEGEWPLRRGSGRHPSEGCGLGDVKDGDGGRFDNEPGAVAVHLDEMFARK